VAYHKKSKIAKCVQWIDSHYGEVTAREANVVGYTDSVFYAAKKRWKEQSRTLQHPEPAPNNPIEKIRHTLTDMLGDPELKFIYQGVEIIIRRRRDA
jgi:hypothetical protein